VKVTMIESSQAPEDTSGLSAQAKQFREILLQLTPGKTAKIDPEGVALRGFKASLTRQATKLGLQTRVWDDGKAVYLELKPTPASTD
jgi:hypothetical protein